MDAHCKVMAEHLSNGYIKEVPNLDQPWPEEGCHYQWRSVRVFKVFSAYPTISRKIIICIIL